MPKNDTITDQDNFKIKILNQKRFNELAADEKELFEILRNSMLEIFPIDKNKKFDTMCVNLAENFAFINIKAFNNFYEKRIKIELDEIRTIAENAAG